MHEDYFKYMLYMNNELNKKNHKLFQPISLRKSVTNQFVHFDTSCIKDIFGLINKKKVDDTNDLIWNEKFNIKNIRIPKNYSFNHQISTDGISVSINLILNSEINKKEQKIKNMTSASKKTKDLLKECVNEDKKNAIRNKILKEEENKLNKKIINRQKQQQKKEEFKKLPKKEQERIKLEEKLKKNKIEYIEDAIKKYNII